MAAKRSARSANSNGSKSKAAVKGRKKPVKRAAAAKAATPAKKAKAALAKPMKAKARSAKPAAAPVEKNTVNGVSRKARAAAPAKAAKPSKSAKASKAEAATRSAKPEKTPKASKPAPDSPQQQLFNDAGTAPAPGVGNRVPDFSLRDQNGHTVTSAELLGKPYVLYFYPKDDTPGCTKEACDFRDQSGAFGKAGVRVIGVSPDSQASHAKFVSKYGLGFTLLSDPDKTLAQGLGVWQKKKNYGREYMGIVRSTFLVDATGTIQRAWRSVKVAGHIPSVLDAARK